MEYLKVRILKLRRKLKITEQNEPPPSTSQQKESQSDTLKVTEEMEVTEQESEPQPSTSQQSDLQPLKVTEKMNTEACENESDIKGDKKRPRLSQNQINGLILKLLSRTTSNVTAVSKDITDIKKLNETFCEEMVKINSKVDKLTKTLS